MKVDIDSGVGGVIIGVVGWLVAGLVSCVCFVFRRKLIEIDEIKEDLDDMNAKLISLQSEKIDRGEAAEIAKKEIENLEESQRRILRIVENIEKKLSNVIVDTEVLKKTT